MSLRRMLLGKPPVAQILKKSSPTFSATPKDQENLPCKSHPTILVRFIFRDFITVIISGDKYKL
jgi:hypothetical protein